TSERITGKPGRPFPCREVLLGEFMSGEKLSSLLRRLVIAVERHEGEVAGARRERRLHTFGLDPDSDRPLLEKDGPRTVPFRPAGRLGESGKDPVFSQLGSIDGLALTDEGDAGRGGIGEEGGRAESKPGKSGEQGHGPGRGVPEG